MEPRYERRPGKRDGESILVDLLQGFIWHVNGYNRFRCLRFHSHYCRAALFFHNGVYITIGEHSHGDDHMEIRRLEFENWCKNLVRTTNLRLHFIYEQALVRFRDWPREMEVRVQFNSIRRTLQRVRNLVQPRIPHSVEEAAALLTASPRYRTTLNGQHEFYWGRVSVPGQGEALIFINLETLPAFLDAEELNMDATFYSAPEGYYQLASLHAISFGMAINVGMFLMTRKTRQLYEAAIGRLLEVCFQQTGRRPAPIKLVSDYEVAILESMSNCFPSGSARGCWYHSGNAKFKKAVSLGLAIPFRDCRNVRMIIKMTIALALLPPDEAHRGLRAIENLFQELSPQFTAQVRVALAQYLVYIQEFWFDRVGPERFCVYDDVRRTNNFIESWHRRLNQLMGVHHPNFWNFIANLQIIAEMAALNYRSLAAGERVQLPRRRAYQEQDRKIAAAIANFDDGYLTIVEFLRQAANYFEPVDQAEILAHNPDVAHVVIEGDEVNGPAQNLRAAFEVLLPVEPRRERVRRREEDNIPRPARRPRLDNPALLQIGDLDNFVNRNAQQQNQAQVAVEENVPQDNQIWRPFEDVLAANPRQERIRRREELEQPEHRRPRAPALVPNREQQHPEPAAPAIHQRRRPGRPRRVRQIPDQEAAVVQRRRPGRPRREPQAPNQVPAAPVVRERPVRQRRGQQQPAIPAMRQNRRPGRPRREPQALDEVPAAPIVPRQPRRVQPQRREQRQHEALAVNPVIGDRLRPRRNRQQQEINEEVEVPRPVAPARREEIVRNVLEQIRIAEENGPRPVVEVEMLNEEDLNQVQSSDGEEDFQWQLDELNQEIEEEQRRFDELNPVVSEEDSEEDVDVENIEDPCAVCQSRNPNIGLDSCNHKFCHVCLRRLGRLPRPHLCPLCRAEYRNILPLVVP